MSHEPECPTGKEWYEMCECETLRSAYRRGREDAAKAVEAACRMWQCSREELAHYTDAARGDGEQA